MEFTNESIHQIVLNQRRYFNTGETLPISFRIQMLKKLKVAFLAYEERIAKALYDDLGKDYLESYLCEIGSVLIEINESLHHLKRWGRPKTVRSGLMCFPSKKTKIYRTPYGVSLIVSPFNFPIYLTLGVLVAAISGGNTAVIKASSKSANCTKVMQDMINEYFDPKYITVIDGGHDIADYCLNERFDKIFYTGSPKVGVHVLECAAKNLTPTALELGGENGNWCIIRKDANLKDAARKVAFFKILNSGQICININQVAVAKEVSDEFVKLLKEEFIRQIGEDATKNDEYSKMISKSAYKYCLEEANQYKDRIVYGGFGDEESLKISPTIIYPVKIDEPIVNHELFNPIIPIVTYEDDKVNDLLEIISNREHGLALYVFTKNIKWANKVMSSQQFGGGCINEVCNHFIVKGAPFNGTGHSGMGAYHGEYGFNEFTHPCTVLVGKSRFNLSLREHPYHTKYYKLKTKIIKKLEK